MKWLKALLIFWIPCVVSAQTPETALKSYIENGDKTYKWEIKDTHTEKGVTRYNVLLTSQKWREFVWKHQLTVFVPEDMAYDGALLFITGGSVKNGEPNWSDSDDRYWPVLSAMAKQNKAVTAYHWNYDGR
jgi:PhoPQ-activated pathogenicity-related protein